MTAENMCFPFTAQIGRVRRQLEGHKPEEVCIITDLELTQFNASAWLKDNRLGWAIESGLHHGTAGCLSQ